MSRDFTQAALEYHQSPRPGKIAIQPTKPLVNQHDLSLAYSPGVAAPCACIQIDPSEAFNYTAKGNLVAVVTNGTAVLGLGDIGPLAAKPVMEGKSVLFKKFAGIDVFDLEIQEKDPEKLADIIASLEPTFGGINLEDIKAPDCFIVEKLLRERLNIPVFHDDQHGTAIIVAAAVLNALAIVKKDISRVKLVASGAGAAALACLDLLVDFGLTPNNIYVVDVHGVLYMGRTQEMDPFKESYLRETTARTLDDLMDGADIFLGLSAGDVLKASSIMKMNAAPIIFALANPTPEIAPALVKKARDDAIIATGRSDFPNQVNNVLCFPYLFRGALDVGATCINHEMKKACVLALAELARIEPSEIVARAYGGDIQPFGPESIIPKPFDPRLLTHIAPAVAKAAMDSGVAQRPLSDLEEYRYHLETLVFRSWIVMRPVFTQARTVLKRVVYSEGEDDRVLHAVQMVVNQKLAQPILIGRPEVIRSRIQQLCLSLRPEQDFEILPLPLEPTHHKYLDAYDAIMSTKRGRVHDISPTALAAIMVRLGDADAMLTGTPGGFLDHVEEVTQIIGLRKGVSHAAALSLLILDNQTVFISDGYINIDPSAQVIAEMALLAAEEVRRFGVEPRVALVSHSNAGSHLTLHASKMSEALQIIRGKDPQLVVDGEMHADAALDAAIRLRIFPGSTLQENANLLIMPSIDAANIALNLARVLTGGLTIGPILLGVAKPAHILTPSVTARGILNMTAYAVVAAQQSL